MKLSIIIPYYKTYELTCILLDNLCKQLTKEVEIILIDDGTNETRLDSYSINILHLPENKGLSHARNEGIKKATGEYITFVDSDDKVSESYIKIILNKINSSEFDYCLFSWKFTGSKVEEVLIKDEAPEWNRCVWNCIYKRDKIGLFEEGIQIHEDSIFNLKYRKGKRENIEEVLYYYFFNRKDSISNRFAEGKTNIQEEWNSEVLLSIIIPYYKTYELTRALLDELCNQYDNKMEIILIQDGCDDNFEKYPIKIIKKENGGVSSARNRGLDVAIGKYIAFIDSDDMIKDNYVSTIINKIESENFDYCLFSWEATGRIQGQFIIKDNPPSWNTCVWNCVYKRELIGDVRFNENKQINEDTDFNNKVRKGKKANILDVLYTYNSGRPDSLTDRYGKQEITEEIKDNKNEINSQVVIYRSYLSKIGGIETAIYNACESLKDIYDITFVYDNIGEGNLAQLVRLKKLVKCVNYKGQEINCDTFMYYGVNPQRIEQTLNSREVIQQICNNFSDYPTGFILSPKTTKFYADSQASAEAFTQRYKKDCGVLHNLFNIKPRKSLMLVSASRLSPEKGYNRMKSMAKRMKEKGIPFVWLVFTNDLPDEDIDGFIFMKPRLNVVDYMNMADYVLQLSDFESWGCTITEALECGVPVIASEWASVREQIDDGVNGYILKQDLSNIDDVIDKMYANNLRGFKYTPKYSIKEWTNAIGNLGGKKDNYIPEEIKGFEVIVEKPCFYTLENKQCEKGDILTIETEARLDDLVNRGYVKLI